jgi:hypothetical protein
MKMQITINLIKLRRERGKDREDKYAIVFTYTGSGYKYLK